MAGIAFGTLMISFAYLSALLGRPFTFFAPWLLAAGIVTLVVSLLLLGARREHRKLPGAMIVGVVIVGALLALGFGSALAISGETSASPLLLGLPRRAALLIYGVGLAPVIVLPLVFAKTFNSTVLSAEDLARLREQLAAERRETRG